MQGGNCGAKKVMSTELIRGGMEWWARQRKVLREHKNREEENRGFNPYFVDRWGENARG